MLSAVLGAVLAIVAMLVHRQAASRMLVVDPEAQDHGVLVIAEEARPALVVTEVVAIGIVVLLAEQLVSLGVVAGAVIAAVVLIGGLLIPTPPSGGRASRTPAIVRLLARTGPPAAPPPAARDVVQAADPLDEGVLTRRILRFQEQEIDEVMVPRSDVVALEAHEDVRHLLDLVEEHRHSRYPVFDGDMDHVVGYVNVFDLRRLPPGTVSVETVVRSVLTVPEGKSCTELLDEMVTEGHEFALVVDEFGGTAGIVTIEDLVEELIGEIWDEHEKEEVTLRRVGKSVYVSQATIPLGELSDRLQLELPEGDYETLAGFLLEAFGRIPVRGETVTWGDVTFEVLRADKRKIDAVQITFGGGGGRS